VSAHIAAWWTQLWPNLIASLLWAAPGFTVHHLLMRRHVSTETAKQTKAITARIDAAQEAHRP